MAIIVVQKEKKVFPQERSIWAINLVKKFLDISPEEGKGVASSAHGSRNSRWNRKRDGKLDKE